MTCTNRLLWNTGVSVNSKSQITNIKQIPKVISVSVIEYWNLEFVCYLVLGVWDFVDPAHLRIGERPKEPLWG